MLCTDHPKYRSSGVLAAGHREKLLRSLPACLSRGYQAGDFGRASETACAAAEGVFHGNAGALLGLPIKHGSELIHEGLDQGTNIVHLPVDIVQGDALQGNCWPCELVPRAEAIVA